MAIFDLRPLLAGEVELYDARRRLRRRVQLEPFEIGVVPVTEPQHAQVMGGSGSGAQSPVVDITWLDAIRLCNATSTADGLAPTYSVEADEVIWSTDAYGSGTHCSRYSG